MQDALDQLTGAWLELLISMKFVARFRISQARKSKAKQRRRRRRNMLSILKLF